VTGGGTWHFLAMCLCVAAAGTIATAPGTAVDDGAAAGSETAAHTRQIYAALRKICRQISDTTSSNTD